MPGDDQGEGVRVWTTAGCEDQPCCVRVVFDTSWLLLLFVARGTDFQKIEVDSRPELLLQPGGEEGGAAVAAVVGRETIIGERKRR